MPEIEITEDQRDRLRAVQEALEADVVGKYGHVRASDAVEYLLDRYEADADGGTGDEAVAPDDDGDEGSGTPDDGGADADGDDETTGAEDDGGADADGDAPAAGGADALDAMMNLLDEHDDRWREASSEEARYEVELPDGSTEGVRTKDDVRGLLFRHYR